MKRADQLILAAVAGAVAMLCLCILFDDLKMAAHAGERSSCRDEPDKAAFMIRRPSEGHGTEYCAKIMRFGSKEWVPEFQHPLGPQKNRGEVR